MRRTVTWFENTDKPVAEVAFDLGYTDASHFTCRSAAAPESRLRCSSG